MKEDAVHVELHLEAEDLCVRLVKLEDRSINVLQHECDSLVRLQEGVNVGLTSRNDTIDDQSAWSVVHRGLKMTDRLESS